MARNKIKQQNCANCSYAFGQDENFCPKCGQENHIPNQPIKHYIVELVETLLHLDSKFFHTIWVILRHPGLITKEYNENKRTRYMPPIRLYVFISLVFFVCIKSPHIYDDKVEKELQQLETLEIIEHPKVALQDYLDSISTILSLSQSNFKSTHQSSDYLDSIKRSDVLIQNKIDSIKVKIDSINKLLAKYKSQPQTVQIPIEVTQDENEPVDLQIGDYNMDISKKDINQLVHLNDEGIDSFLVCRNVEPSFLSRILIKQSIKLYKGGETNSTLMTEKIIKFSSVSFFFLMPIFGFILYLLYYRRKRNYYESLIFSLHFHIVVFLILGFLFLINIIIQLDAWYYILGIVSCLFYLFKGLRLNYNQSRLKTFIKFTLLTSIYSLFLIVAMAFAMIFGFLTL